MTRRSRRRSSPRSARLAFTLVELLVVIGIIALLIAVLLPALSAARRQAQRVKASSDVRQLMVAYTAYYADHRGWLLYGYPTPAVSDVEIKAFDPVTGVSFDRTTAGFLAPLIVDRFPWRLVSYFPGIWPILHSHDVLPRMTRRGDSVSDTIGYAYNLSLSSAYGINAAYVGGTKAIDYPSFTVTSLATPTGPIDDGQPVFGRHCVFRANEVHHPTRLLVFAESQSPSTVTGFGDPTQGLPYLMPPRANGKQFWDVAPGERVHWTVPGGFLAGLPQGRYGSRTVSGFFDGHVEAVLPSELADMRYWCDKADTPDFNYAN